MRDDLFNFDSDFSFGFDSCDHWEDPVKVGRYTIRASALLSLWHVDTEIAGLRMLAKSRPHDGIYLTPFWTSLVSGQGLVIPWPDRGAIPVELVNVLVQEAVRRLEMGRDLEIGCLGAHGRTGVLLACLICQLENKTARQAIEAVKQRHCCRAVETLSQYRLVYKFEKFHRDSSTNFKAYGKMIIDKKEKRTK